MKKHIATNICSFLMLFAITFFIRGSTAFAYHTAFAAPIRITYTHVCAAVPTGHARCNALIAELAGSSNPLSFSPLADPTGGSPPYAPTNLHSAYNLPTTATGTPTVAIVDAYSDPDLAKDLATYRSMWSLPACTTFSGCLKIVNQTGGTKLPAENVDWGGEESLDVDMVSAICQNCHILVVEATDNGANLSIAVNEAVKLGAIAVSNSYGESEFSSESSACTSYYQHNHVAVTASTGDDGPGVEFPSVCPYVTGVGGTTLNSNGSEKAWNTGSTEGAGGGCSAYIPKPSWQSARVTGCSKRAVADVSADADPNTGVFVYDSFGEPGWVEVGGTSESSPIIASVFALAGNVSSNKYPSSLPWKHLTSGCLFKIGGVRYAFQTGLGSSDGIGCF